MKLHQMRGFVVAVVLPVVIYALIFLVMQVASADLVHTSRTIGYYSPKPLWLACAIFSGVVGIYSRSRWVMGVLFAALWTMLSPAMAWSGPGDEAQAARAMQMLSCYLYLAGFAIYALLLSQLIPSHQTNPFRREIKRA